MGAVLSRRATATAAASCMDQEGLVELFDLMNVNLGVFLNPDGRDGIGSSSLATCINWGKFFSHPNGHEAQLMRTALQELGEDAPTCDSSLFELCVGRNPGNSSGCQVLENVTVRSTFCHGTCAVLDGGVDCPAQNPDVESALVEVMDTVGYAEENRTGPYPCWWSGVYCSSAGSVELSMPNYNLSGTLGPSLGKLCPWLTRLVLRDNKLQGVVPSELSQCTRLRHLQLQNNMFRGEVPNVGSMSELQELHLQSNLFSGQMPEDMFHNASQLRLVNLSRNSLEGPVPDLEAALALNAFDASRNLLSGLGKLPTALVQVGANGRPEPRPLALDLSFNAFVGGVPEQLLEACALTEVNMAGNGLTQLPIRGYWSDVAELRDHFTHEAIESKGAYTCPWGEYPDRDPPCWPVLRWLDFSGNPFNAPFQQFYAMLAQATQLQEVACEDCMLQGPVPVAVPMQYAFKASGSNWSVGCKPVEVHQFLEKFNVQNNPDLGCQVVQVQKTGQRVQCLSCPQYMKPPENASLPLQEQSECRCMASLQRYDTKGLQDACGCDQGMFLNQKDQECQACRAGRQDCEWQSAKESKSPPRILPGNWAPELVEGETFSHQSLVRCQKESCPQEEGGQCAPGRDPGVPGCGECLPGHYGREGECQPCEDGGQMRYVTIGLGLLAIALCMIPLMRGLVYREAARVVADRLPEEEVTAKLELTSAFRQATKHIQVVSVQMGFTVQWPKVLLKFRSVIRFLAVLNYNFGFSCLAEQQTTEMLLGEAAALPLALLALATLAFCLTKIWGHRSCCPRISGTQFLQFVFFLWALVLPSQMLSAVSVWRCQKDDEGISRMMEFPHIDCESQRWWDIFWLYSLAPLVGYILPYILAMAFSLSRLLRGRKGDSTAFLWEGFRAGRQHWALAAVAKDLLLSVLGASFAGNGTLQCFSSGLLVLCYAWFNYRAWPRESRLGNRAECSNSAALIMMYLVLTGFAFTYELEAPNVGRAVERGDSDDSYTTAASIVLGVYATSIASTLFWVLLAGVSDLRRSPRCPVCLRAPVEGEEEEALRRRQAAQAMPLLDRAGLENVEAAIRLELGDVAGLVEERDAPFAPVVPEEDAAPPVAPDDGHEAARGGAPEARPEVAEGGDLVVRPAVGKEPDVAAARDCEAASSSGSHADAAASDAGSTRASSKESADAASQTEPLLPVTGAAPDVSHVRGTGGAAAATRDGLATTVFGRPLGASGEEETGEDGDAKQFDNGETQGAGGSQRLSGWLRCC